MTSQTSYTRYPVLARPWVQVGVEQPSRLRITYIRMQLCMRLNAFWTKSWMQWRTLRTQFSMPSSLSWHHSSDKRLKQHASPGYRLQGYVSFCKPDESSFCNMGVRLQAGPCTCIGSPRISICIMPLCIAHTIELQPICFIVWKLSDMLGRISNICNLHGISEYDFECVGG